jgi:hypothetical protein
MKARANRKRSGHPHRLKIFGAFDCHPAIVAGAFNRF